jgi:hypothetical protein
MSITVKPSGATGVRSTVRRWPAVLALAVAAPLIAEISLGSLPVSKAWMLLVFGYIYSAGALLIREAIRRRRLAVGSMLALGLAFGLMEEGLALGSLTSTTLYPVADWAPRLLGFNTAYSLWVLPYHAVFSIAVPVAIVDLIFPRLKAEPYLRTRGIVAWAIALVLGLAVIRLALIWMDPEHVNSAPHLIVIAALATGLIIGGLSRAPEVRLDRPVPPRPWLLVVLGAVSVAGYFALLWRLPGAPHSAYLPDRLAWLAPVLALILLAAASNICRRCSSSTRWSATHTAAVVAGALPAHSLLGLIAIPIGTLDRVLLGAIMVGEVAFGIWLVHRARSGTSDDPA